MERGFAHAEKTREQNVVHLGQRFDDLKETFDRRFGDLKESVNQRFDSLDKRLAFQNRIMLGILGMLAAGLVKYLFFQ